MTQNTKGKMAEGDAYYKEGEDTSVMQTTGRENRDVMQTTERERTGVWCRLQRGREQGCDTD